MPKVHAVRHILIAAVSTSRKTFSMSALGLEELQFCYYGTRNDYSLAKSMVISFVGEIAFLEKICNELRSLLPTVINIRVSAAGRLESP